MRIKDSDRHLPATVEVRGPIEKGKFAGKYIMGDRTNGCYRPVRPVVDRDEEGEKILRWEADGFEDGFEGDEWEMFKDCVQ